MAANGPVPSSTEKWKAVEVSLASFTQPTSVRVWTSTPSTLEERQRMILSRTGVRRGGRRG